jgi:hypothetical protein
MQEHAELLLFSFDVYNEDGKKNKKRRKKKTKEQYRV